MEGLSNHGLNIRGNLVSQKLGTAFEIPGGTACFCSADSEKMSRIYGYVPNIPYPTAEAEAILWAVQITVKEGWSYVSIERDSKTCMDYLSHLKTDLEWSIRTIISNVAELAKFLASCAFGWDYLPPAISAVSID
ncbi:hypothetical protein SO802_027323 [Lithocarpus litseifolius]|uniref:RNase H type-1 domain-containing protein n=1 Tax=Lithocarpus litseifolius TaxID=425828 RepID=A0AAW2C3Q5_9ROSI